MGWLNKENSFILITCSLFLSVLIHFPPGTQVRRKILSLLDCVDFGLEVPQGLRLEYMDPVGVEKMIAALEQPTEQGGPPLCDVRLLHRFLTANLNSLQGASAIGQRPMVLQVEPLNPTFIYRVVKI